MSRLTATLNHDHPSLESLSIGQRVEVQVVALVVGIECDLVHVGGDDSLPGETVKLTLEVIEPPVIA